MFNGHRLSRLKSRNETLKRLLGGLGVEIRGVAWHGDHVGQPKEVLKALLSPRCGLFDAASWISEVLSRSEEKQQELWGR